MTLKLNILLLNEYNITFSRAIERWENKRAVVNVLNMLRKLSCHRFEKVVTFEIFKNNTAALFSEEKQIAEEKFFLACFNKLYQELF